ncbi:MAG: hypothetical protein V1913_03965 [Fibrobacterota bacterium]
MFNLSRVKNAKQQGPGSLSEKYPPSKPCDCEICRAFCARPGWWTVEEADAAMKAGLSGRMMLEMAPDNAFGVLAPAFKGCETAFATQLFVHRGCTFLKEEKCELHGTGQQPLECRFCHHERPGQGPLCHADIEKEWNTPVGSTLIVAWGRETGFLDRLRMAQMKGRLG